jgi:CubicO group peptidase (beta-lactamase class C family)
MSYQRVRICLNFTFLLTFLQFWLPSRGQGDFSGIDQLLKENQKSLGNNAVLVINKDGKMVYQKQVEKQEGDFNARYQAPLLSSGQWMTAALVMTFVDEGKLSLEDKVSKFIPIFGTYMKSYITIRNCLTHTTGIQADAAGPMKLLQKSKFETLEDEVSAFASKREIQTNPGTEFFYSELGPDIAGRVLEIISRKSFDRLMQERIIRPLKMRGTLFTNLDGGAVDPYGGGQSTAADYVNFLVMLLNKGVFAGKRVLSEKSVAEMEKPQFTNLLTRYTPRGTEGFQHGLGVWIWDTDSLGAGRVISGMSSDADFPFIDRCRNYAGILLLKSAGTEARKDLETRIKALADEQIPGNCP